MIANKKGDANIWWIIIGAVIALVVLIVLMLIFTQKTSGLSGGLSDCEGKGGICIASLERCPQSTLKSSAFTCSGPSVCCIGTPKPCTGTGDCLQCITDSMGKSWCA